MSMKEKRKVFLEAKDKKISKVKDAHESVENILFCLIDLENHKNWEVSKGSNNV